MRTIARRIMVGFALTLVVSGAALLIIPAFWQGTFAHTSGRLRPATTTADDLVNTTWFIGIWSLQLEVIRKTTTDRLDSYSRTAWLEQSANHPGLSSWSVVVPHYLNDGMFTPGLKSPALRWERAGNWRVGGLAVYVDRSSESSEWIELRLPTWPIPLIGLAILATTGPLSVGAFRRRSRVRRGACVACGHDRRSLAADAPCPECGKAGG